MEQNISKNKKKINEIINLMEFTDDEWKDGTVNTSEDPESTMRSSWLQLERLEKRHAGTYHCIANNSIGEASAFSKVMLG